MLKNNYTPKSVHVDSCLSLLIYLSSLLYLEKHKPFNFALAKVKLRKALKLTFTEFRAIYTAYNTAYKIQRGAV